MRCIRACPKINWHNVSFESPSASGSHIGFSCDCQKPKGRKGWRAVCAAYRRDVKSNPSATPPVPAVRRCITSKIAPQVLPSLAAGAGSNLCLVFCGTEQALARALLLLCLFTVRRLVEVMLLPAWLTHLELQMTVQVPLQHVEELVERYAKACEETQSLKESRARYQHYLEKELPKSQKELSDAIDAIQISNDELKQHPTVQQAHQIEQLRQDTAQLQKDNAAKKAKWGKIISLYMSGHASQVQTSLTHILLTSGITEG